MKRVILYMLAITALALYTGGLVGYNIGYTAGLQTGQADQLMKFAGKCFLHITKELNKNNGL